MDFIIVNPSAKRRVISGKSKAIMREMAPKNYEKFNYSKGWYERFRRRYTQRAGKISTNNEIKDIEKPVP